MPRRVNLRPTVGPRPLRGGTAAGSSPVEIRALGLQQSISLGETRRLDEQRRVIEKIKRDTIRKKLNK